MLRFSQREKENLIILMMRVRQKISQHIEIYQTGLQRLRTKKLIFILQTAQLKSTTSCPQLYVLANYLPIVIRLLLNGPNRLRRMWSSRERR